MALEAVRGGSLFLLVQGGRLRRRLTQALEGSHGKFACLWTSANMSANIHFGETFMKFAFIAVAVIIAASGCSQSDQAQKHSDRGERASSSSSPAAVTSAMAASTNVYTFQWLSTDKQTDGLGQRHQFTQIVKSLLSDKSDPSTGPTVYDSWRGIGYTWVTPDDVSTSPNAQQYLSGDGKADWAEASLIRMTVGPAAAAEANAATVEQPWLMEVRAETKWVDAVIFAPRGDCYIGPGKRCEEKDEDSFKYIHALTAMGAHVTPIKCPALDSSTQDLAVYKLQVAGKKPQTVWTFSTSGSSGVVYKEFGIYFNALTGISPCSAIAGYYQ